MSSENFKKICGDLNLRLDKGHYISVQEPTLHLSRACSVFVMYYRIKMFEFVENEISFLQSSTGKID